MNRNIRLIYTHSIFTQMLFLLPVVVPYYHSIGLSFRDFLLGEAFFSAVVLLAEVPSGWVSDVWKRRTTLMCGALFGMIGLSGAVGGLTAAPLFAWGGSLSWPFGFWTAGALLALMVWLLLMQCRTQGQSSESRCSAPNGI